jgi:DNA-binding response OmpR family regulator
MLAGVSILLVDDDIEFAEVLARRLTRRGAQVRACVAADECLNWLQNEPVDIVITDRSLSGNDGLLLVRRIREDLRQIPVLMLSGHSDEESVKAALAAGVTEYLIKPTPLAELEVLLARYNMAKNL